MVFPIDARRVRSAGRLILAPGSFSRARAVALAWALAALLVRCALPSAGPVPEPTGFPAGATGFQAGATGFPAGATGFPAGPAGPAKLETGPAGWRWPVDGVPRVVRRFDAPANPFGPGHRGVDLAAEPGATVRSAGAGVVWFAGLVAGRGVVSVRHPDGRRTTYEPLHVSVRMGATVRAGTPLGQLAVGHPGCPAPACLHWGLLAGETYQDPLSLLRPERVRLYPF